MEFRNLLIHVFQKTIKKIFSHLPNQIDPHKSYKHHERILLVHAYRYAVKEYVYTIHSCSIILAIISIINFQFVNQ